MWQPLYDPPFVLRPKHAAAFRLAACTFSDMVGWEQFEDDWPGIDIAVFDNLTQHQKQVAILTVAKALLDPDAEPPDVTAVLAGTVDAIYVHLYSSVELEMGHATRVRQMILEALDEMDYWKDVNASLPPGEEPETPPTPDSMDHDEWSFFVDVLRDEILDDYDFSMEQHFMDLPPAFAEELKDKLNIDQDYFVATVEDPTQDRVKEIREQIKRYL